MGSSLIVYELEPQIANRRISVDHEFFHYIPANRFPGGEDRRKAVRESEIVSVSNLQKELYGAQPGTVRVLVRPSDAKAREDISSIFKGFADIKVREREVPEMTYSLCARSKSAENIDSFQKRIERYVNFTCTELRKTGVFANTDFVEYFPLPLETTNGECASRGALVGDVHCVSTIMQQIPFLARGYDPVVHITSTAYDYR